MRRRRLINKFISCLVALALVLGQIVFYAPPVMAAEDQKPTLVITGTGLKNDVVISGADWSRLAIEERYFSSNNKDGFHKINKVKGYDLFSTLIGAENLNVEDDTVYFTASDGFERSKTVKTLKSEQYYYRDFTENNQEPVNPMIGVFKKELFSAQSDYIGASWEDQPINEIEDKLSTPQIIFGQSGIDDKNQSSWVSKLVKIRVGDERPPIITIKGTGASQTKSLNLAELALLPADKKITDSYTYLTKAGNQTDWVEGVDLSYLLKSVVGITDPNATIDFISADGYDNTPISVADLSDGEKKYVLAYKKGSDAGSLALFSDTAKDDNTITGQLRVYSQDGRPIKLVNEIVINAGEGGDAIDFTNSPFKHINAGAPYNVDSITGATLTVEGPGVEAMRALSMRQLEEANAALHRGSYSDLRKGVKVTQIFEGIKLSHILDNFIKVKNTAAKVIIKDRARQFVKEFTFQEIKDADAGGKPIILAYGVGVEDQNKNLTAKPLIYTDKDAGYDSTLQNDNGCLRLVYDQGESPAAEFLTGAYIYVTEDTVPGYEHNKAPYNDPKYTQKILTISGTGVGREVNFTVDELEGMTDIQYTGEYSLSNSEYYWYYNNYRGVRLWDLLLKAGVSPDGADDTRVQYHAADGYNFQPVTLGEIKNDGLYGYYEKDPNDMGDGKFDGSVVAPLNTGYPVLVAYGFNQYPYVINPQDPGYNSGLSNDGGPLRVIFGKKSYGHINGSNQVQLLDRIVVGEDFNYTTHSYGDYSQYQNQNVLVKVEKEDGTIIDTKTFTLEELENIIYGAGVAPADAHAAKVKEFYYTKDYNDSKISDLYEGIDPWYLLNKKVGLPGTIGTVTFKDAAAGTKTLTLNEIRSSGANEVTGKTDLKPVLAFAKMGYPLVDDKNSPGYVKEAKNNDGFLMLVCPQNAAQAEGHTPGYNLKNVKEIIVTMQADHYAHLEAPYDKYAGDTLTVNGPGAQKAQTFTVSELEKMQDCIITADYCVAKAEDNKGQVKFRGIDLYRFLKQEVGLQSTAASITVTASDYSKEFTLEELMKDNYVNELAGTNNLKMMLAYGCNDKPLVPDKESEGYDAVAGNNGGPLKLVVGQLQNGDFNSGKCVGNVTSITVNASVTAGWKHDQGVYTQYQNQPVLRITGDQVASPRTFTLAELEAMENHIVRNDYTFDGTHEMEGVVLWNLISQVIGLKEGMTTPSSVRIFSGPGYNTTLANMEQLKDGVENNQGLMRQIIVAYGINGYPLVPEASSPGYENNNQHGPLRLIIENNKSQCVKQMDCIVVGNGNYEDPKDYPPQKTDWTVYRNDDGSGLPNAGVRCITPDGSGGIWVGTNGGGAAYRNASGQWTIYNTTNGLKNDTVYDIAVDGAGGVWMTQGSQSGNSGVLYLQNGQFTYFDKAGTEGGLPDDFVQQVEIDGAGGVWFGTAKGVSYYKDSTWTVFDKDDGLPGESINTVVLDQKGGVWIGCYPDTVDAEKNEYSGGYAYRSAQGEITAYRDTENKSFADQWVRSITIDKNGGVWVVKSGSYAFMETVGGRIDYINPQGSITSYTGRELVPSLGIEEIRYIAADPLGGIWIGTTASGLYHSKTVGNIDAHFSKETFDWPTSPFDSIWHINAGNDGMVWVGTNGGVAGRLFEAPASVLKITDVKLLDTWNNEVTQINKSGGYRIKVNLNNTGSAAEQALTLIQVRNGTGADAVTGGQVIGCTGIEAAIPVTGAEITGEFILPSFASGKSFVDVFVWDGWTKQNPLVSPDQTLSFIVNQ